MTMKKECYRQGDVLAVKIDKLPVELKPVERDDVNRIVLAHGERTGHAHAIRALDVTSFVMETADRDLARTDGCPHYIAVGGSGVELNHEHITGKKAEHDVVFLPSGNFLIAVQVEESAAFLTQVAD